MKNKRQETILKLISEQTIDTQELLLEKLQEEGFRATQATISRDIRDLKLVKNMTERGNYRYELATRHENPFPAFNSAMAESILRVDYAGHMLVIHTYPGMANAVAAFVDSLKIPSLLGCVAGDDTILAVASESHAASEIALQIRRLIRKN